MTRERQEKQAALALLACMAAVALTLWGWPTPPLRVHRAAHADVALPAPQRVAGAVPFLNPASDLRSGQASVEQKAAISDRDAAQPTMPEVAPVRPAAPVLELELATVGDPVSVGGVLPIASRTIALPMQPLVPDSHPMPSLRRDSPGNSFAHAGVALGSAFRRAGVNTGAAFTRIF